MILVLLMFSISFAFAAEACDLSVSLVNQDPYPAVQGDYVKMVFQVDGIAASGCGEVTIELIEKYPISFDGGEETVYTINSGTYTKDFQNFLMAPFKIRVDENALDGANPVEVRYSYNKLGVTGAVESKEVDLEVEDVRADFEVFVKDYDYASNEITLDILNIGGNDIEALTVEIPEQEGVVVKGAKKNIVGDLDSNEDTTADFEATLEDGTYKILLSYSDSIDERRTVEKEIGFDSSYFTNRAGDQTEGGFIGGFWFWVIVIGAGYWYWKKKKAKKK